MFVTYPLGGCCGRRRQKVYLELLQKMGDRISVSKVVWVGVRVWVRIWSKVRMLRVLLGGKGRLHQLLQGSRDG